MDLSIVIVNWNVKDYLLQTLRSIYNNPPQASFEVFVVDNASSDDSVFAVKSEFQQVKIIESKQNIGFSGANNLALAQAMGNIILLLNPDTEVLPHSLDELLNSFDRHPKAGLIGAQLLTPDREQDRSNKSYPSFRTLLWTALFLDDLFPKNRIFGEYRMSYWDHQDERQVDQPSGAAMAIRKEILEKVGYMDDHYFLYCEEADWSFRIKKAGYEIWFTPSSKIIHYGGRSTRQSTRLRNKAAHRSLYRFFYKRYPFYPILTHIIVFFLELLKFIVGFMVIGILTGILFLTLKYFKIIPKLTPFF